MTPPTRHRVSSEGSFFFGIIWGVTKRGRPFSSKDTTPRKRRTERHNANIEHNASAKKAYIEQGTSEEVHNKEVALEEAQVPKNSEISISYVHKGDK